MNRVAGKALFVLLVIAEVVIALLFAANLIFVGILGWDLSFDTRLFWTSPSVWIVLLLYPFTFLVQRKNAFVRNEDLPWLFRGYLRFLFVLLRGAVYTAWRLLITTSARPDWRTATEGLSFFVISFVLLTILAWFGYGKIMRSRINQMFFDDLKSFAEERGGRTVADESGIRAFILNAQSINHSVIMGDPIGSQEESLPQVVVWPKPPQGIAVHWLTITRRNAITKHWSVQIRWTLCLMGKLRANLQSERNDSIVLDAPGMTRKLSSPDERKRWTSLSRRWNIKSIELLKDDYLIVWTPPYDWKTMSIRPPSKQRLDMLCRETHNLLSGS